MKILFKTQPRSLYDEIKDKEFQSISFKLYNKIDDELIPQIWSKNNNEVYGIDDFENLPLDLSEKDKFLLSMHNKEFLKLIGKLRGKIEKENQCIVYTDFKEQEINIIKLKSWQIK